MVKFRHFNLLFLYQVKTFLVLDQTLYELTLFVDLFQSTLLQKKQILLLSLKNKSSHLESKQFFKNLIENVKNQLNEL